MCGSLVRCVGVFIFAAILWTLNISLGVSATITQATVTTDLALSTFDFEIQWSSAPDFATTDSFKYNILNPTTAANCCSPYSGWSGFAGASADYQVIEDAGVISLYSGNDFGRTFIATIPFNLTGNVLDFAIAFSLLTEPNGLTYELEHFLSGSADGNVLVGLADGNPAGIPGVPLPGALPLFATGLGMLGLLGWRTKQKSLSNPMQISEFEMAVHGSELKNR